MTADRSALAGFSEIPRRLIHCLNSHRVRYEIIHAPEGAHYTFPNTPTAPVVTACVVNATNQRVLIVIPVNGQLDLKKVRAFVGQPFRLETEDEFKWLFPDCALGAVPLFGNLYGLATYMDRSLLKHQEIVLTAGTTTDWIKLACDTYLEIVKPALGRFLVTAKGSYQNTTPVSRGTPSKERKALL